MDPAKASAMDSSPGLGPSAFGCIWGEAVGHLTGQRNAHPSPHRCLLLASKKAARSPCWVPRPHRRREEADGADDRAADGACRTARKEETWDARNGALAIGPKLPRPSSTLPERTSRQFDKRKVARAVCNLGINRNSAHHAFVLVADGVPMIDEPCCRTAGTRSLGKSVPSIPPQVAQRLIRRLRRRHSFSQMRPQGDLEHAKSGC
jgi:hypothetical protein